MKIQKYGSYRRSLCEEGFDGRMQWDWRRHSYVTGAYKEKRFNGDEKEDTPNYKQPEDGKITWVKGRLVGDCVYGVKKGTGRYEYECRYDEGPGDKKWMEECDRNYLARLYLIGANTTRELQDLAENRNRAAKAAKEIAKLPEEQLSTALKKFYITLFRTQAITIIYEITILPIELITIITGYLTGNESKIESKDIQAAITSSLIAGDSSPINVANPSGSIYIASFHQSLWNPQSTQALSSSSSPPAAVSKVQKQKSCICC